MWRATWKSLLDKKVRLALTALSVVLGVGFMAGTFVLTDTMTKAFDELIVTGSEGTDVVVRSAVAFEAQEPGPGVGAQGRPMPETLLEEVRAVDGVRAAYGDVAGIAQLIDPSTGEPIGGLGPPTIGSSWSPEQGVFTIREGEAPDDLGEVAVDASTARRFDLRPGMRIEILSQGPPREFTITGVVGFGEADNLLGATVVLFELRQAQILLGREGRLDAINVEAEEGVSASELRTRIEAVLPERVEAVTGSTVTEEAQADVREGLGFLTTGLLVFAFVALFVGAFIILNTFSIIVAQRTRELALLRAVGATRRQVTISVLAEALAIGLLAAVIGVLAGIGIALALKGLFGAFGFDLPSTQTQILPRTVVASLIVGLVVTLVSSVVPARRAARVPPVEALRTSEAEGGGSLRRRLLVGLALTALGAGVLLFALFVADEDQAAIAGVGAAVTFVGVAVLTPVLARPVARVLGAPLRRLSVAGKLGRENAMRNPRRTASTSAALMIGLGLVAFVAIFAASLKASSDVALRETLKADLILTGTSFTGMSPEAAEAIRRSPVAGAVAEFRQAGFRIAGSDAFLTGATVETLDAVASLEVVEGELAGLAEGGILVHEDVAASEGWEVGEGVPVAFAETGRADLPLAGIFAENRLVGDYVVSLETFDANVTGQLDQFILVRGAEGVDPTALAGEVEDAVAGFANIEVQDQAAFREKQAGLVDTLLGLVSALLGLAIVIALFGIVNTLSLSIHERTRELGLLRAVGMTRRQVRSMVRWESVIIAVMGAALGIAVGIFFGWAMQRALASEGITELAVPVGQLLVYVVFAGLAGVVAAVFPARRAAKLDVLQAIAYE